MPSTRSSVRDLRQLVTRNAGVRIWSAVLVVIAAGCGAVTQPGEPSDLSRYGIHADLAPEWDGRIGRGALYAANFSLSDDSSGWLRTTSAGLRATDVFVMLFERDHGPGDSPAEPPAPELRGPLHLDASDFDPANQVVDDGHGHARRLFSLSGRDFILLVEAGALSPRPDDLAEANELLASLRVDAGDFFRRKLEPARFPPRPGWHVGTSGARDARADGDWLTSWASTVKYLDEWNSIARTTLASLPRDGIVIWVGLDRDNRFATQGDPRSPEREPPFDLDDFEHRASWEGQVRELPEYLLWGTVRGEYRIDLRVYFGRQDPTASMREEAQAMLDRLELPDWGPWELDSR